MRQVPSKQKNDDSYVQNIDSFWRYTYVVIMPYVSQALYLHECHNS